ncbi:Helix-turn-helix protein [Streptomyces sp. ADI95-16]|uniref:helix-turn-helix domain-containing protein n=1 Tax=Streptomyces sp. ADI95-16 TaxID=1522758 RepID=UPI000F42EE50|nr:Helix-turn-helix protein [Streptomyces sp. ADI95-16]
MSTAISLGEFLRTRRSLLHLEDVALPDFGGQRRVAGLRREEIAQLAGVSVDYYTRMEQGRVPNPSGAVLDALARALRLDGDATRHCTASSDRSPPPGTSPGASPGRNACALCSSGCWTTWWTCRR